MRGECIFYLFFVLPHEHLVHELLVLVLLPHIVLRLAPGVLPPGAVFHLSSVASLRGDGVPHKIFPSSSSSPQKYSVRSVKINMAWGV